MLFYTILYVEYYILRFNAVSLVSIAIQISRFSLQVLISTFLLFATRERSSHFSFHSIIPRYLLQSLLSFSVCGFSAYPSLLSLHSFSSAWETAHSQSKHDFTLHFLFPLTPILPQMFSMGTETSLGGFCRSNVGFGMCVIL